jgi:hypothetical protein
MAIKTSSAKAKGRKHQQWVRDQILAVYPQLEPDDVRSTSMGAGGEDVQLSPSARKLFPYSVECKAHKAFAIYTVMDQAETNCPKNIQPMGVIKADRRRPLVVIDAEYFFGIMERMK